MIKCGWVNKEKAYLVIVFIAIKFLPVNREIEKNKKKDG